MRKTLIGAGILMVMAGAGIRAQDQPSPLNAPTTVRLPTNLPACGVNTVTLALARASHVAIGFEESTEEHTACAGPFVRVNITHADSTDRSTTVAQVLDQLMMLAPAYRWADMDGVAVIRPVAAWTDSADVLNGRVAPLHVAVATVSDTLDILLRKRPDDSPPPGLNHFNFHRPPFAMTFDGGTLVEAFNALVRASGNAGWMTRVLHASGVDGTPALQLTVRTFNVGDRTGVDGAIITGAPVSRLVAAR